MTARDVAPAPPAAGNALLTRIWNGGGGAARLRSLSLVAVLSIWELFGRANPLVASYPSEIFQAAREHLLPTVLPAFAESLHGFATGYAISIVVGIPLGLIMSQSRILELALAPYVSALYAMPRVALIPVLILWLGVSFELRVGVVIISGLFAIILNTYLGAKEVDQELVDVGSAFAAGRARTIRTIIVPASVPYIFAGLRIGMARSLIGIVVAEIAASTAGVGHLIKSSAQYLQMARMFVPIILLGLFAILLTDLFRRFERRATQPWLYRKAGR